MHLCREISARENERTEDRPIATSILQTGLQHFVTLLVAIDPTDERAAKANLPPVDSLSMWPLLSGQVDIPISNKTLISGRYKIQFPRLVGLDLTILAF